MIDYDDDDLKEWAERIWASEEYRGGGVKTLKAFISWLEVSDDERGTD